MAPARTMDSRTPNAFSSRRCWRANMPMDMTCSTAQPITHQPFAESSVRQTDAGEGSLPQRTETMTAARTTSAAIRSAVCHHGRRAATRRCVGGASASTGSSGMPPMGASVIDRRAPRAWH
jgi:hypothetical protein